MDSISQFLHWAETERKEVDVNYLLESTLGLVEKEMRVRDIQVERQFQPGLIGYFHVDGLRHIFLNLIMNAMQAMPEGGTLYVRSSIGPDERVYIEFEDTGVGIPEENLKNIFAPFFTTKPVGEGTGLGLYIANSIATRDGGKIEVKSEEGKGSTFTVILPVVKQENGVKQKTGESSKWKKWMAKATAH
ncbi:MAG: hypothetical protein D6814_03715 [Calditrichaeota bacterium]|nr:MAG: hypothetical protein D6814_03715 [Calditrichota bacterium]